MVILDTFRLFDEVISRRMYRRVAQGAQQRCWIALPGQRHQLPDTASPAERPQGIEIRNRQGELARGVFGIAELHGPERRGAQRQRGQPGAPDHLVQCHRQKCGGDLGGEITGARTRFAECTPNVVLMGEHIEDELTGGRSRPDRPAPCARRPRDGRAAGRRHVRRRAGMPPPHRDRAAVGVVLAPGFPSEWRWGRLVDVILEHGVLSIRPGQEARFEAAFATARPLISCQPGFVDISLSRSVESPNLYLLLVEWESVEAHTQGFRTSPEFAQWRQLLHHFYDPAPVIEHFVDVR